MVQSRCNTCRLEYDAEQMENEHSILMQRPMLLYRIRSNLLAQRLTSPSRASHAQHVEGVESPKRFFLVVNSVSNDTEARDRIETLALDVGAVSTHLSCPAHRRRRLERIQR